MLHVLSGLVTKPLGEHNSMEDFLLLMGYGPGHRQWSFLFETKIDFTLETIAFFLPSIKYLKDSPVQKTYEPCDVTIQYSTYNTFNLYVFLYKSFSGNQLQVIFQRRHILGTNVFIFPIRGSQKCFGAGYTSSDHWHH